MTSSAAQASTPITSLGATSAPGFLACRLQFALGRGVGSRPPGAISPPALLGDACHAVLESLTASRAITGDGWQEALEAAWTIALADLDDRLPAGEDPRSWRGFNLARARLKNVAERLRELLSEFDPGASFVCEEKMTALNGALVGRPDLVIRASDRHWIVDYKTGGVVDPATSESRPEYVTQLQLYAVLEHAETGDWPSRGFLLPFVESSLDIDLIPSECERVAADLSAAVDAYNERVPAAQPASPSPHACRWCRHAVECDAVWQACQADWAPQVHLATGAVAQTATSGLGAGTIIVDVDGGTVQKGRIAVTGVDTILATTWGELEPGMKIRLSGLRKERGERTFSLAPWGTVGLEV